MLAGEQNPEILAELAHRRMQGKREQLVQALQGTFSEHHRFLLASQLRQLDFFDHQIQELDQEIAHRMGLSSDAHDPDGPDATSNLPTKEETQEPPGPTESAESNPPLCVQPAVPQQLRSATAIRILDEIPGVNERIGTIVVAELGTQMHQFPDEAHLSSWVGLCPAAKISANKRLSTKTGKGNRWLRQALIEAANAAARSKDTFLGAYYQRLRKRMGHKKALVALAHRILILIYHLLKEQQAYRELGPGHVDEKAAEAAKRRALRTLEQLGYDVTLQSAEVA
jgi:transposase